MGVEFIRDRLGQARRELTEEMQPGIETVMIDRQHMEDKARRAVALLKEASGLLGETRQLWTTIASAAASVAVSTESMITFAHQAEADQADEASVLRGLGEQLSKVRAAAQSVEGWFPPTQSAVEDVDVRVRDIIGYCEGELIGPIVAPRQSVLSIDGRATQATEIIGQYIENLEGVK